MEKVKIRNTANQKRGRYARRKGFDYERKLASEFRSLGYPGCMTTRQASRIMDACKIDLFLPDLNIQAKNTAQKVNFLEIFELMRQEMTKYLPDRLEFITAIFHKHKGNELVVMKKADFYKLIAEHCNYKTLLRKNDNTGIQK